MAGLAGALYTAALALFAKVLYDGWARIQERRGLAGALAGEIASYIQMLHPESSIKNFLKMKSLDRDERKLRLAAFPELPTGHPVFDKVAGDLGKLPSQEASDVSAFYNIVTGLRVHLSRMSSPEFFATDEEYQKSTFDFVIQALKQEQAVYNLIRRLDWIAGQGVWSIITTGFSLPRDLGNASPRKRTFNLLSSGNETTTGK